jgi:hypothetical protein
VHGGAMSKYAYAIAVILLVIGIGAYGHRQKVAGRAEVRAERVLEQLQEVEDAEAHRIARQAEINKLASVAAAADAKARKSDQLLAEQVDKNVPNTLPLLPGSYRVQHDLDALGRGAAQADDSSGMDADPVAPRDVAKTTGRNYAQCRQDQRNLKNLQGAAVASGCFDIQESK